MKTTPETPCEGQRCIICGAPCRVIKGVSMIRHARTCVSRLWRVPASRLLR